MLIQLQGLQTEFTPEIEVLYMLLEISLSSFSITSLKQPIENFNFRCKIQLDLPVVRSFVLPRPVYPRGSTSSTVSSSGCDRSPRKKDTATARRVELDTFQQRMRNTYRDRPQRKHVLKVVHSPQRPPVTPLDATPRLSKVGRPRPPRPPPKMPKPRLPKNCASANKTAPARMKRRGSSQARILSLTSLPPSSWSWAHNNELPLTTTKKGQRLERRDRPSTRRLHSSVATAAEGQTHTPFILASLHECLEVCWPPRSRSLAPLY